MGKKRYSGDRTPSPGDKDKKRFRSKDKYLAEPVGDQIRGHDRTGVQKSLKPFRCLVCWKEYVLERALRAHLLAKHPQISPSKRPTHQPCSEEDVDEKGSTHSSVEAIAGESQAEDEEEPFTLKRRLLQAFYDDVAFQNADDDRDVSEVGRENGNMPPMSSLNKDASLHDEVGVDVVNSNEKSDGVKDPKTKTFDNNPSGGSKYRREFVKLLLSATEACEVLLNRFGLDIDSLMTAIAMLSMEDAGAKQVNEESNINQDVQMVPENESGRKENTNQSIVSPSTTTSDIDCSTVDKNAMTKDEGIGSERSPISEINNESNECDIADESGNIGSRIPIVAQEEEDSQTELDKDALIGELQKKLQERDKQIERLQEELQNERKGRKEEPEFAAQPQHVSNSDFRENESVQNCEGMDRDDGNAVGPGKLFPAADDGREGAGADQNEELKKDQVFDFKALTNAVKEKRNVSFLSSLVQHGADWKSLDDRKRSLLHVAAEWGTLESLKFFLELGGLDVNGTDEDEETPLHGAVYQDGNKGVLEKCKLLAERGVDLYAKNHKEETFLHNYVCKESSPTPSEFYSMAAYLVENGHSSIFNVANVDGNTPLHFAVRHFEPEERTLRLLHSNCVDFNAVNKEGNTILSLAAYGKRSFPFLQSLVTLFSVDPTKVDSKENSLLHLVAAYNTSDALKLVLDLRLEGLDVNGKNLYGNTPLYFLLLNSKTEVLEKCRLLVSHGADVNSLNKRQQSPLHLAASVKDEDVAVEVIKFLIERGADPSAKNENDYTFLHHYLLQPNVEPSKLHRLVEFLLEKHHSSVFDVPGGKFRKTPLNLMPTRLEPELKTLQLLKESGNANFNAVGEYGNSALHLAIIGKRSMELLANLVNQFGSDPKLLNNKKESILHTAAYFGTVDGLKFCCEYGLDINGKNVFGGTPLHFAVQPNSKLIDVFEKCRLLVSKGANVNNVDCEGNTPLAFVINFYEGADKDELISLLKQQN